MFFDSLIYLPLHVRFFHSHGGLRVAPFQIHIKEPYLTTNSHRQLVIWYNCRPHAKICKKIMISKFCDLQILPNLDVQNQVVRLILMLRCPFLHERLKRGEEGTSNNIQIVSFYNQEKSKSSRQYIYTYAQRHSSYMRDLKQAKTHPAAKKMLLIFDFTNQLYIYVSTYLQHQVTTFHHPKLLHPSCHFQSPQAINSIPKISTNHPSDLSPQPQPLINLSTCHLIVHFFVPYYPGGGW